MQRRSCKKEETGSCQSVRGIVCDNKLAHAVLTSTSRFHWTIFVLESQSASSVFHDAASYDF